MNKKYIFPDQWIYINSPATLCGRVTNFSNWGPNLNKEADVDILCWEYWCFEEDSLWQMTDEQLVKQLKKDKKEIRLLDSSQILDSYVIKIPKSYPVLSRDSQQKMKTIRDELVKFPQISIIGRYGSFKYNNQDHCILMGLQAAENILRGKRHDLWTINTDLSYQENTIISDSGLGDAENARHVNIPS